MNQSYDAKEKYDFKRSFYYEAENAVRSSSVTFLLGARRCGKTVCMKQLYDSFDVSGLFDKVIYADIKKDYGSNRDKMDFINHVVHSIQRREKILYLIDEATYMQFPDREIMKIQDAFTSGRNDNTKVVFTGSQSKALEHWGHLAFAGDAAYIRTDFLSYPEWLAYKGVTEVSEKTYYDFLSGTRKFYKNFHSTREYLQGCLDETVISNNKAGEIIYGNDCSIINNDMLLDVLYASLISLHNHVNYQSFVNRNALTEDVIYHFSSICGQLCGEVIATRTAEILGARYQNFKRMSSEELLQSLQFLVGCGLVTVTHVTDDLESSPYYTRRMLSGFGENPSKQEILKNLNIFIKYPMFYMDIVKDLLEEQMPDTIPHSLLGSIVECHVRGILPDTGSLEYRDADNREIDYVNTAFKRAIEVSVSNKKASQTHFDALPDGYKKILLSKDKQGTQNGIEYIPYYKFIFDHSDGKELHQRMARCIAAEKTSPTKTEYGD